MTRTEDDKPVAHATLRSILAIVIPFGGIFGLALFLTSTGIQFEPGVGVALFVAVEIVFGVLGAACIDVRLARDVLRQGAKWHHFVDACVTAGAIVLAICSWAVLTGAGIGFGWHHSSALAVIFLITHAPLMEEWMFRGILWEGCSRIMNYTATNLTTASLFAVMHVLQGSGPYEVPHRLVAGFLLGRLRHRSESLWPGVLAHFITNFISLFMI